MNMMHTNTAHTNLTRTNMTHTNITHSFYQLIIFRNNHIIPERTGRYTQDFGPVPPHGRPESFLP